MSKQKFRRAVVALALTSLIGLNGCYGSFALARSLHSWNGQVTGEKFVNALIFFGLCVVPVYELLALGDVLLFNTIEFYTGENPIALGEGMSEPEMLADGSVELLANGHRYRLSMLESTGAALLSVDGLEAAIVRKTDAGGVAVTDLARARSYEIPSDVVAKLVN